MNGLTFKPKVLLDTPNIIIVNKPHSLNFHSMAKSTDESFGIARMLSNSLCAADSSSVEKLYPVHRLDAITSGALIFAKNLHTARALGEEFSAGRVTKYYVALSARKPSKKQGSVVGEMIKTRRGSWMLQRAIKNRPAVTRFTSTAVKDASFEIGMPPLRAFLLKPSTGRTHQIRVAMKSLGAPIFGDARYSNIQNDENAIKSLLGTQATLETPMELSQQSGLVDRGYLHATALRFCLGEEQIQIVCKPEDEDEGFCFAKIEGVKSVINHWFPSGIENEYGAWFPDDKLLQSSFKMTE